MSRRISSVLAFLFAVDALLNKCAKACHPISIESIRTTQEQNIQTSLALDPCVDFVRFQSANALV